MPKHDSSLSQAEKKPSNWLSAVEEVTGKPATRPGPVGGIVYLLLDVSPSMEGKKLSDAIEGVIGFSEDAVSKGYAVGVIRFSGSASIVRQPSQDVVALAKAVRCLTTEDATKIEPPLALSYKELGPLSLRRAVVLFTDGQAQDQPAAIKLAEVLKHARIEIITIGTEDADSDFLRRIATRNDLAVAITTREIATAIRASAGLLSS